MKLDLIELGEHGQADTIIATIECVKKDIATIVKVFELFDKSIRYIKLETPKKGRR